MERAQNRVPPGDEVKVVYAEDNKAMVKEEDISKEELESNKVLPRHKPPDKPMQSFLTTRRPKPGKQV